MCRNYYTAILSEFNSIFNRYADVLKNLPIVSNGTKLRQTTTDLLNKFNAVLPIIMNVEILMIFFMLILVF